jgi:hypothetical protein
VTLDRSPAGLAFLYGDLGRELSSYGSQRDALAGISRIAVSRVPGADWASITEGRNGTFRTVAATDEAARTVDEIQYDLGTGPCVDAILEETVFRTDDLREDERWPAFAQRVAETNDVRSMLSFRLFLEDDDRISGLNLYSTRTRAFDEGSEVVGTLIATHGALAIQMAAAREEASHLHRALLNSREIGMAMGVLMARHKISRSEAFDLLRVASQNSNRKLVDIASDVAETGLLDLPGNVKLDSLRGRRTPPAATPGFPRRTDYRGPDPEASQ